MALLGEDGRGYELARKLENHGVWRTWLGDALYSTFIPFLLSPATWDAFMRPDDSKPRPHISLQLRVRALLFDRASVSLFTRLKNPLAVSMLNPHYLELHGDDLYFTLESSSQNGGDQRQQGLASNTTIPKVTSKSSMISGSRYSESEVDAPKRFKHEELPETWYSQFFEKYRASKTYRLMFFDKESEKRTPEQMSAYLRVVENHKRKRVIFKEPTSNSQGNSAMGETGGVEDPLFFPETMFTLNCVPDSAVVQTSSIQNNKKVPSNGVLDNLPPMISKGPVISPMMIERLGIRPEYLSMEQGIQTSGGTGYQYSKKLLSEEQALQMSQKVVARLLSNVGFDSSSETSLGVLGELLSAHAHKFGRILKLLADSYRKQYSAIELIKMFLQTLGYSDVGALSEIMKDNARYAAQQMQQQVMGIQAPLQLQQQQPSLQQAHQQQILRQMGSNVQQLNTSQYLALQNMERMRRRQQSTPRPAMNMNMDKDRQLVQVKMENPSDFPIETSSFTGTNTRNPQMQQLRQQQLAAISSLHAHANQNNFRPMASLAVPQIQSQSIGMARAPPVKVEGFQELMGVDSSLKHNTDENKLLQPQK